MQKTDELESQLRAIQEKWLLRAPDELKKLANLKRFRECFLGDPDFRQELEDRPENGVQIARQRGIHEIDPMEIAPWWRNGFNLEQEEERLSRTPLGSLWHEWSDDKKSCAMSARHQIHEAISDSRFKAWHARQMARCSSEVGGHNEFLSHAVMALELTKGCSVGCWFCGVAADKLQGVFTRTPENALLWREILQVCKDELGAAAQSGLCYWATEPFDNPDYFAFLDDFREIIGVVPGTTTAAALRDVHRTRRLLQPAMNSYLKGNRFSVTSLDTLRKIHEIFSGDELLNIDLVLQNREALTPKSASGRYLALKTKNPALDAEKGELVDPQTIACVSGFLVNMVERSIKLISPCKATDKWPLGHRIFWEGAFSTAGDFRACIRQAIEAMPTGLKGDDMVCFRNDLTYERLDDGFTLKTRFWSTTLNGAAHVGLIGDLINDGSKTTTQILNAVDKQGFDYFSAVATLKQLFDQGLIEEPTCGGNR